VEPGNPHSHIHHAVIGLGPLKRNPKVIWITDILVFKPTDGFPKMVVGAVIPQIGAQEVVSLASITLFDSHQKPVHCSLGGALGEQG